MQAVAAAIGVNLSHSANLISSHLEGVSLNSVTTLLHSQECSRYMLLAFKRVILYQITKKTSQLRCKSIKNLSALSRSRLHRSPCHTIRRPKQKITAFSRRNNYPIISETENHCMSTKK